MLSFSIKCLRALEAEASISTISFKRKNVFKKLFSDKKVKDGKLTFILCQSIGKAMIKNDIDENKHLNPEEWDNLLSERAKESGKLVLSEFTRKTIERFKQK